MTTTTAGVSSPSAHCSSCGLIAVGTSCPGCQRQTSPAADRVDLPSDLCCAVVRVELPCRVCGLKMPVNHLPRDGQVRCLHCDRAQAADEAAFRGLVRAAHGVVDLAGEAGPYAEVGVNHAAISVAVGDGDALIGPGLPRCVLCQGPLRVTLGNKRGALTSVCSECHDTASYHVDLSQRWHGLLGAIATEHRTDQPSAKRSVESSVVALSCPKCGGPLDPNPQQQLVRCGYCDTQCLIVEETWALLKGAPPKQAWYLFFGGPSQLRRELEAERTRRARRAEAGRYKLRKAEAREHQRNNAPAVPLTRPSWYQRNRSLVAGYSTIVSAFACSALVAGGAHVLGYDEAKFMAGFVAYFVVAGVGIALQGKGKIASMSTATATRVFNAAAICFLLCLAAFLVVLESSR